MGHMVRTPPRGMSWAMLSKKVAKSLTKKPALHANVAVTFGAL